MKKRLLPLLISGLFRGFGAISQFLLAWWVSSLLTKEASGSFFYYLACYTILSPLLLMGTQYFGMRRISEFEAGEKELICRHAHHAARLSVGAAGIAFFLLTPSALIAKQMFSHLELSQALLPLSLAATIGAISNVVASHLHGLKRFGQSIFYSHICIPTVTILAMSAVQPTHSIGVIYCHLFACIVSTCVAVITWSYYFPFPKTAYVQSNSTSAWATSRDLWLIYCCNVSINWFPIIVAGAIVGTADVADLNIGQRAANLINFVLVIITFAFAPRLRQSWAKSDLIGLRQDVSRCTALLISVGTVAFVVVCISAEHILSLFGSEYVSGANLLRVFATAQYFNVITGSVNEILLMWGFEKTLLSIFIASATVCFAGTTALGIILGPMGIAVGASIAIFFHNILAVLAVRKHLGFWAFDPRQPATASSGP